MLKSLGKNLMNNIGLKILALFFATALWLIVVNVDNPMVRKSMTVSVTLKNQEYITEMGKYMDVLNDSNTVTFQYTTKRSIWENISTTDFSATADLKKIEAKDNGTYRVPVVVTATRNASQITIETKQVYMDVTLEDLGKQQFQIKANTTGTVADGCALGEVTIDDANVVQVSGPVSVINRIDSVIAVVNVDGMSAHVTDNVVPVFFDSNGAVIDTTKLEKSIETVNITARILNTKDVPLALSYKGTLPEGYQLVEISSDPITVRVKGEAAILNTFDKIEIPAEVMDITNATSSIEKTIDISTYLPEGVSLVISSDAKVEISAEIEKVEAKEFKVPVNNITASGLRAGYQLSYLDQSVNLTVKAGKTALGHLNASTILGTINVEGLEEGKYVLDVSFDLDGATYSLSNVTVEVELTKETTETPDSENTESGTETTTPSTETSGGTTSTETTGDAGNSDNTGSSESTGSSENTGNSDSTEAQQSSENSGNTTDSNSDGN